MKKTTLLICILLALLTSVMLTGCENAEASDSAVDRPVAVAFLIGNHSCSKALNIMSTPIQEAASMAVSSYGYVSVICIDGDPHIVLEGSCDIDARYKQADPQKLAQDASARTLSLLSGLQTVVADTPEVDTLAAVRLAVRSLSSAPENAEKVIIVLDPGLSTTGECDFRNNLLAGDPEAISEELAAREAIPDLSGIQVIWQQMGDVDLPQESLSPKQINHLKAIWQAIIERGGGTLTLYDAPPLNDSDDNMLPEVSTVDLAVEAPIVFTKEMVSESSFSFDEPVFIREEQVQFVGDSDAFVDPAKVLEVVTPIAELMAADSDLRLLLVGTTAGDGKSDYSLALSSSRAEAVKSTLVSLGVGGNRIVTLGMAGTDPWHIYNVGTQGELAAQNRKVVILNADTTMAQELLAQSH